MPDMIRDGTGSGNLAGVDVEHRLRIAGQHESELSFQSFENALAFAVMTDFIPLVTTGVFSGLLYIKNTGSDPIRIYILRASNGALAEWKVIRNPTTGTLISAGLVGSGANMNFGSNKALSAAIMIGSDGKTITDGTLMGQYVNNIGVYMQDVGGAAVLPTNSSVAVLCKPSVACDVGAWVLLTQAKEE